MATPYRSDSSPALATYTFKRGDYSRVDQTRAKLYTQGYLPALVDLVTDDSIKGRDGMARRVTYTRTRKGWKWVERSAKGTMRGMVDNPIQLTLCLARIARA